MNDEEMNDEEQEGKDSTDNNNDNVNVKEKAKGDEDKCAICFGNMPKVDDGGRGTIKCVSC